jgi:thioredoxin 1
MSFIPSTINNLETYSKNNPSKLIVLNFKASWCNPCKLIYPFITYLKEQYKNVDFFLIDIEDEDTETITQFFNIKKVPTFIYYKNVQLNNSIIGTNKDTIEEYINEYL